jgi:poly-beta-1,6-N-acetyl-D-glucosamine synthase
LDNFILDFFLFTFSLATIVQVVFWVVIHARLAFFQSDKKHHHSVPNTLPSVSVVICAKNEEKNLRANLDRILTQSYHSFEVLLIDDHSTDKTYEVLLEFQKKYSYLRIIKNLYIKKTNGKKAALSLGIQSAQHEIVLLTDADCAPESSFWIQKSIEALGEKDILLGYGPYEKEDNWLNRFVRFETVTAATQYFSYALIGLPYMGVGRNLCYRKKIFTEVGGFAKHEKIASGDDDLFVNAVANGKNTAICIENEQFMHSEPKKTWQSFFRQKMRHLTTGKHYRWQHQILLSIFAATQSWHYFSGIIILLIFGNLNIVFFGYMLRFLVITFLYYLTLKKLRELSLLPYLPILDAMMAIYYVVAAPISLFIAKTKQWN